MEETMAKMHTHPEVVEAAISHIADYVLEVSARCLKCADGLVDIFWYGDDFATQSGMMISPELWRKLFRPVYGQIFALAKTKGFPVWFHSCGSFVDVLPDLIDIGMDVWETCQVHLKGNDPRYLKREFGNHIAFCGAVNTQQTLPFGSTSDVRREVRERIRMLGQGGGYICGPDHTVRPEVPVENLVALFDEAKKYRDPQCTRAS
jgi:uroporphyrinogen decarboxylase